MAASLPAVTEEPGTLLRTLLNMMVVKDSVLSHERSQPETDVFPKVYVATKSRGLGVVSSDSKCCVLLTGKLAAFLMAVKHECLVSTS